jgi:hypothetical protein
MSPKVSVVLTELFISLPFALFALSRRSLYGSDTYLAFSRSLFHIRYPVNARMNLFCTTPGGGNSFLFRRILPETLKGSSHQGVRTWLATNPRPVVT